MPQIILTNLSKTFFNEKAQTHVLKNITLNVEAGSTLGILGSSGSGKSTLLNIIGTLEAPTSGEVFFEDKNLFSKNDKDLEIFRNKSLGFIFQFHHLMPDFTVLENVMMPLLIRGMNEKEAAGRSSAMLHKVGMGHRLHFKPSHLSGGESQRTAVARALVGSPQLVLADEPTGNLDANHGDQVFDLLLALNHEIRATLIVVTHNERLAKKLNQILYLVDGHIQT